MDVLGEVVVVASDVDVGNVVIGSVVDVEEVVVVGVGVLFSGAWDADVVVAVAVV